MAVCVSAESCRRRNIRGKGAFSCSFLDKHNYYAAYDIVDGDRIYSNKCKIDFTVIEPKVVLIVLGIIFAMRTVIVRLSPFIKTPIIYEKGKVISKE